MDDLSRIKLGKVTFHRSRMTIKDRLVQKGFKRMAAEKPSNTATKEWYASTISRIADKPVAHIVVENADADRARAEALLEINRALNVLRFYLRGITSLDPFVYRMLIGPEGTISSQKTFAVEFTEDMHLRTFSSAFGLLYKYSLDKKGVRTMRRFHLNKLDKVLSKEEEKRSPFEKSILLAIDFFGAGMHEGILRNAFVNFIISLECLLLRREAKAVVLAERIALILGTDSRSRQIIHHRMIHLYEIRSDIVHEGIDKVNKDHLYQLSELAFSTIVRLIPYARKINDKKVLKEKIDEIKYHAPRFRA